MDVVAALPQDAQLELFSRVGNIKDLFKFAMMSRGWLHRFSDRDFLNGIFKDDRKRLLGFFFQETRFDFSKPMMKLRNTKNVSISAPSFMPSPWSQLISPKERSLTNFIPDHDGTFSYAKPLAARQGIVLMQLVPRTYKHYKSLVLLSLCNPITGGCHKPPPLDCAGVGSQVTMYAIITAADLGNPDEGQLPSQSGHFMFSQLLLATQEGEHKEVYLHSYYAATRSWSTPTICLEASRYSVLRDRAAVVHHGMAHWLCTYGMTMMSIHQDDENIYKLSVDVGTMHVSITKLPFHAGGSRLLRINGDGKLSVTCVHVMHVTLWIQQEYKEEGHDTPIWHLHTTIRITPHPNFPHIRNSEWQWFDFNRRSLHALHKVYRGYSIFFLDLEKKVMEDVHLLKNDTRNHTFVPYEMDLVEFFMLRFRGIRRRLRIAYLSDDLEASG